MTDRIKQLFELMHEINGKLDLLLDNATKPLEDSKAEDYRTKKNPPGSVHTAILKVLESGEMLHNLQLANIINKDKLTPALVSPATISATANNLHARGKLNKIQNGMWSLKKTVEEAA